MLAIGFTFCVVACFVVAGHVVAGHSLLALCGHVEAGHLLLALCGRWFRVSGRSLDVVA